MKKNNVWKIVCYVSIMSILLIILYLVILYKVAWETKDFNTYLYFYDCKNDVVCTSTTKPKDVKYNKIVCEDDECPYVSNFLNNIVILTKNDKMWLYDYEKGQIHNEEYVKYDLTDDGYFKVTDHNNMQAIINIKGDVVTKDKYKEIIDYNYGLIVYKDNNKCGIDYVSGEEVIAPKYDDIMLIDNTMYAVLNDNKYQIYNVVNNAPANGVKYDYIWSSNKTLIVVKDKQLDVLNNKLESNLLMKINTNLSYTTNAERKSLNIRVDGNFIYFNVNINNIEYTRYKYDTNNKKISVNN